MSPADDDDARVQRARAVALFRYALIREAADPALSTRQRGRLVRELAARGHAGPFGEPVTVSRPSLDRWIRAWRSGGFDALAPPARQVTPRTPAEVLELAAALKRENPDRTAAQVARILRASGGWSPSDRTLQRHFTRLELTTRPDGSPPQGRGKIERLFRTVREQFLVEITGDAAASGRRHVTGIAELNRLFTAWAETVYHQRVHSETGQAPLQRWAEGWAGAAPPLPGPGQLHEALDRKSTRLNSSHIT